MIAFLMRAETSDTSLSVSSPAVVKFYASRNQTRTYKERDDSSLTFDNDVTGRYCSHRSDLASNWRFHETPRCVFNAVTYRARRCEA